MELLGDMGHVEAPFGAFGDGANLDARWVHSLCQTYQALRNHFGCTEWNSKETRVRWNLVSVHLETLLVLVQDWCVVCAECTTSSEIVFDTHDGTTS
jgi:hypothetical protein